ncbi:unnamed protein product [Paramecium octaurelia]|uniref:Uncharacterized protein n=1 Tax=Paramecium octaurelia TaxID=43137 RepID=A0A8S1WA63_PAROT|nr:unnamed protein product [Paramecium octaurelia]
MLQIGNYVINTKESKSISNGSGRIDSSQSYVIHNIDNTKFQNPVFKMAPLENFQSVSENKYSHIFSSFEQSPRQEDQQNQNQQGNKQIIKKRAFSFTEHETTKNEHRCNTSGDLRTKKSYVVFTTRILESKRKEQDKQLNAETPKLGKEQLQDSQLTVKQKMDYSQPSSPRIQDFKLNDNASLEAKQTQTTAWGSITSKSELDQILKDCLQNFEKNKAQKSDEYVACFLF